jgi:hypothetical protein
MAKMFKAFYRWSVIVQFWQFDAESAVQSHQSSLPVSISRKWLNAGTLIKLDRLRMEKCAAAAAAAAGKRFFSLGTTLSLRAAREKKSGGEIHTHAKNEMV